MGGKNNIIIISNRLPFVLGKKVDGTIEVKRGAGGLVTAMAPVLKNRNGTWVGWPGYVQERDIDNSMLAAIESQVSGYNVKPVMLNADELNQYYEGFSNSIIWPLFHDSTDKCIFLPEYWQSYKTVNTKFASTVGKIATPADFLWVHDYQLILVGEQLRKMHLKNQIGFFLHIPFPPVDTFARCPWRYELLSAMLEYDILGFQTVQDKRNFFECLKEIMPSVRFDARTARSKAVSEFVFREKRTRIGVFPISIDFNEFFLKAKESKIHKRALEMRSNRIKTKVLLGVDRLDYTKGIVEKLKAFQLFLTIFPKAHNKIHFIQLVVPSRREITAYAELKYKIEQLVGEINGQFGSHDWLPVQYMFRALDRNELIALYRMSDIAFVASRKDGMNLICKEYCACNVDEQGVLILSEFTGAAKQFKKDAILINPHDVEGTARAINKAMHLPVEERKLRMRNLRKIVAKKDVFWWVDAFFAATGKTIASCVEIDSGQGKAYGAGV